MKTANWISIFLLLAGIVGVAGCGKQEAPPPVVQGTTIDLPKLRGAFETATPETQAALSEVSMGVRYGDFARALVALEKLVNAPGLTDAQKKVVAEVAEQVRLAAGKATTPPPPR